MGVFDHAPQGGLTVARARQHMEHHRVRHGHPGVELFRQCRAKPGKSVVVPMGVASLRGLFPHDLAQLGGVRPGLLLGTQVFHDMWWGLGHDVSLGVVTPTARPTRHLGKLACGQDAGLGTVVFVQLCEDHRSDWDVDADAQGVGTADQAQPPLLGQAFNQQPVSRQQPCVMHAHAVRQETLQVLAEGRVKTDARQHLGQLTAFCLREHAE